MSQTKKKELLKCYSKALENYCKRKPREGYIPTFFTNYRHSFKEYPTLVRLRKSLTKEQDKEESLNEILTPVIDHFIANRAAFNNHSFNNYFLDELKGSDEFKHIEWDCFTPKAVKHYTGTLYRGDTRLPEVIFKEGFKERIPSNSYSDYLKYYTGTVGISTSKDIAATINYPMHGENLILKYIRALFRLKCSTPDRNPRYIYVIDYQGAGGFDVLKTEQERGLNPSNVFHNNRLQALKDKEVNVKGSIAPEYIRGFYKSTQDGKWLWNEKKEYMEKMQRDETRNSYYAVKGA
ncbi:scabin-related ADP-ribosyltransferase [Rickettsiella endosymbiont of Dermanyssus gallinae]|uniref:scabin-related ADP-ribosyltransferase n=1 Tax=Rickettsiella endosymbiont of Dermanyssus gallinae TaxID=2856608 RepID=UPI001C532875|nr:hypothetical protein [Rickettsiella endosymbiont of Dermanyssus gallinae]